MLRVIYDGEVVVEIEEQVISATLRTNRGSGPPTFLDASTGAVELVIEKVASGGPLRLDQVEAAQLKAVHDRGTEGESVGLSSTALQGDDSRMLNTPQGAQFDTLGKGASEHNEKPDLGSRVTKDLAEGLDADDVEGRTAAINDLDKGGKDSKPKSDNKTTETKTDSKTGGKGVTV